ncbi:hypothetical protein SAZ_29075 [Streptomyces noursei ZPM]|nr:hypothetical protein SAZ_29075 [Streptomyces noursei ZPM]
MPRRRLSQARCTAVSEAEQAVSIAMLGPVRSRTCETRLASDQWSLWASVGTPRAAASPPIHS